MPPSQLNSILSAAHFAAEKHATQKRKGKSGEPYVNHLLEVAQLISASIPEPDSNLLIAALLHDVIEDAGVTKDELAHRFGADAVNRRTQTRIVITHCGLSRPPASPTVASSLPEARRW